jgi:hypothetical protein
MVRLRILSLGSAVLALLMVFFDHTPPTTIAPGKGLLLPREWLVNHQPVLTPQEEVRLPDQTFLTYPEWFLVFGPAEQAKFFQTQTSTKFPFMVQVYQIWEGYHDVYEQIRGNFPFNTGYHVMIVVISTSSTAEFGLKAAYETLIGRLSDTPAGAPLTAEDQFNARFAHDYVAFLDTAPWYDFDFKSRLVKLWTETPLIGPHPIRKWERRYILSTELAVKIVYGWLIGLGTHTAYDLPKLTTAAVVDHLPGGMQTRLPDLKILKEFPDQSLAISLPRYAPFTTNACELAVAGVNFREIAGNSSAILITVLAPNGWKENSANARVLFTQPLPTRPDVSRVALATPVDSLREILVQLSEQKIPVEHIFDF